jgi:hypothetical protein
MENPKIGDTRPLSLLTTPAVTATGTDLTATNIRKAHERQSAPDVDKPDMFVSVPTCTVSAFTRTLAAILVLPIEKRPNGLPETQFEFEQR